MSKEWPCEHMVLHKGLWMYKPAYWSMNIDDWDICPNRGCGSSRPAEPTDKEVLKEIVHRFYLHTNCDLNECNFVDAILSKFTLRGKP